VETVFIRRLLLIVLRLSGVVNCYFKSQRCAKTSVYRYAHVSTVIELTENHSLDNRDSCPTPDKKRA